MRNKAFILFCSQALRRKQKFMAKNKAQQMRTELINNLMKHSVVKTVLNPDEQNVPNNSSEMFLKLQNKQTEDDIFKLPDMPSTSKVELTVSDDYDSDSSVELSPRKQTKWIGNIHSVDVSSSEFRSLPADVRYEILTDLKETRKQNSWGRLHEMPEESHEFSGFQMKRLLKRRLVQTSLESAEKEMGGKTLTLEELEKLLTEQGVTTTDRDCAYRIAGDSTTRLIYISDKNAYIKNNSNGVNSENENSADTTNDTDKPVASSSEIVPICEDINEYDLDDEWDSDMKTIDMDSPKLTMDVSSSSESEVELNEARLLAKKYFGKNVMNPAFTYMLEYSGLTQKQIPMLLEQSKKEGNDDNIGKIAKELQQTDSSETQISENKDSELSIQPSTSVSEDNKESTELDSAETTRSFDTPETELSESNTNSLAVASSTSNNEQTKETETIAISSTDSDSDDFIEIGDAPMSGVSTDVSTKTSQQSIQIAFKADQKIEDDIFADIFETLDEKVSVEESRNASLSEESLRKLVKSLSNREETEDKGIEIAKDKGADNELSSVTKMADIDIQITKTDTSVKIKDVQSEKDETEEMNATEISAGSEKGITEVPHEEDNPTVNTPVIDEPRKINPIPIDEDELLSLKVRHY